MSTSANPAAVPLPSNKSTTAVDSRPSNRLYDIDALKNDASNFSAWKYRCKRILQLRKLWGVVDGTEKEPDALTGDPDALAEWKEKDEHALTQIALTLDDEPLNGVVHLEHAKQVWDRLMANYEGKGKQTMASLIGELFRDTLSDDSPLRPQLDAMTNKRHLLASLGVSLDDSLIAIAMVLSLPPSYSTLRTILMSTQDASRVA